jgi:hypothetical protein
MLPRKGYGGTFYTKDSLLGKGKGEQIPTKKIDQGKKTAIGSIQKDMAMTSNIGKLSRGPRRRECPARRSSAWIYLDLH